MAFKICMIGTQFIGVPADSGGAIEYLSFNIAEGISKKFEVTYFSVDPLIKTKLDSNVLIERFPSKRTNAFFFTLFVLFKALFKKFDVIYVSGCSMIFAGLILSKLKGIPLIYHEFNHNPWIKPKSKLYDFLAKFSVKYSDYVIVASEFIKKKVISKMNVSETKILKISNFILLKEFPLNATKKQNKVLFVGRMVKHKGIDFLIKLIQENNFENWVFEFVCPKPFSSEEKSYYVKLKSLSNSKKAKVILKQNLSRKELIQEMGVSSILVLPSSQEAFGMVLIEAMSCFTPCIAFSVGGTTEIIDDKLNGFLVEEKDYGLFEQKLRELMQDEKKRISFGLNAREKIERNFSFNKTIKEFESFFIKVVKEK